MIKYNKLQRAVRAAISSSVVAGLSVSVAAQEPVKEEGGARYLEEVLVTATRREQSLQEVPLAISAITGESLRKLGLDDFSDYLTRVPGVSFQRNNETGSSISIRGIGAIDGVAGTVAVYIDEAPISGGNGQVPNIRTFDVERVEVLRGPQGTLYGEGSLGGTIKYIMNKPDATAFGARIEGDVSNISHGGTEFGLNGMINLPLIEDKLAVRVSGLYRDADGWIDMPELIGGGAKDVNDTRVDNWRLALRYMPVDELTLDASVIYNETDIGAGQASTKDWKSNAFNADVASDEWVQANFTLTYDFGWAELVSATSYWGREEFHLFDLGELAPVFGIENVYVPVDSEEDRFTQEIRLSSNTDQALDWTVGLFYKNNERDDLATVASEPDLPFTIFEQDGTVETTQKAIFGELGYQFTDRWHASLGLRWFDEEVDSDVFVNDFGSVTRDTDTSSSDDVHPKVSVKYDISEDAMVYATTSQGFRSGGVNLIFNDPTAEAAYGPDTLVNYEVGTKTTWLEGRLTANAAIFRQDWSDVQALGADEFVTNAGDAHSQGIELEIVAMLFESLQLSFAGAYIDEAVLDEDFAEAPKGSELSDVSDINYNVSLDHYYTFSNGLDLVSNINYNYVGESWPGLVPKGTSTSIKNRSYGLLSLNVGVAGEKWSVTLFGDNLTDEYAEYLRYDIFVEEHLQGHADAARPRTVGLRFGMDF